MTAPVIDRVSADDLMSLVAGDVLPPLQVGAVLMIDLAGRGLPDETGLPEIGRRLMTIPRLRQKLVPAGRGAGRPVWVDDPDFLITEHLTSVGGTHDHDSVLAIASTLLTMPLSREHPLWVARLVTGVAGDRVALIVVFHHGLADGIGGLALLAGLVDGAPEQPTRCFPQPSLSHRQLVVDAAHERWQTVRRLPGIARRLASGLGQLGPALSTDAISCSLNRRTGPRRSIVVVRAQLRPLRDLAHRSHSGVNDLLLAVITGGLHQLLLGRGEQVNAFVVSVPFAARSTNEPSSLGNRTGVVPILLPATGSLTERLTAITRITTSAKRSKRGASTALLSPLFRLLAAFGLYGRFINRQRRIHTVASLVRGPEVAVRVLGCPVTELIPLSAAPGNLTVVFEALSYAGRLTLSISVDPQTCPDAAELQALLQQSFDEITEST